MWLKKKKQASCGQRLICANYCPKYNLAGKTNTTFKKFITFSHDANREIKYRQRNGRLQCLNNRDRLRQAFRFRQEKRSLSRRQLPRQAVANQRTRPRKLHRSDTFEQRGSLTRFCCRRKQKRRRRKGRRRGGGGDKRRRESKEVFLSLKGAIHSLPRQHVQIKVSKQLPKSDLNWALGALIVQFSESFHPRLL